MLRRAAAASLGPRRGARAAGPGYVKYTSALPTLVPCIRSASLFDTSHLISIPATNTSVNPARSTGPALFPGGWALVQLWLFWRAPIGGAILGGPIGKFLDFNPAKASTDP